MFSHSSAVRNFPVLLSLTLCASFKVDEAAIFIKMSFTQSSTFSSLGHYMLHYCMKNSSKGQPRGGSSFRIYLLSIKCLGEKQKILNSSHTWMYYDLLWVPSKSTDVCIMNLKDLNNKHENCFWNRYLILTVNRLNAHSGITLSVNTVFTQTSSLKVPVWHLTC